VLRVLYVVIRSPQAKTPAAPLPQRQPHFEVASSSP
jgi:hypothetical protein